MADGADGFVPDQTANQSLGDGFVPDGPSAPPPPPSKPIPGMEKLGNLPGISNPIPKVLSSLDTSIDYIPPRSVGSVRPSTPGPVTASSVARAISSPTIQKTIVGDRSPARLGYDYAVSGLGPDAVESGGRHIRKGLPKLLSNVATPSDPNQMPEAAGQGDPKQAAEGFNETVQGAMEAATPLMAGGALRPAQAMAGLSTGMAAQKATSEGLQSLGVPQPYATAAGNIVALPLGGMVAHRVGGMEEAIPGRIVQPDSTSTTSPTPETPAPLVEPPPPTPPPSPIITRNNPGPHQDPFRPNVAILPERPPANPIPSGMEAAIQAHEQLGPAAFTVPGRLLGVTPYQQHLVETLGPNLARQLPSRELNAQPTRPAPSAPPVDVEAFAPKPDTTIPPVPPASSPSPSPESGPSGPLAEPDYTSPTTPTPVPNPPPEPTPPVVHTPPPAPPPPIPIEPPPVIPSRSTATPIRPNVPPAEMERAGRFGMAPLQPGKPGVTLENDPRHIDNRMRVLVHRDAEGKPDGYLHFYLDDNLKNVAPPEHELYPETYVVPNARRQGIATQLYDAAAKHGYDLSQVSGAETTPEGAAFLNARRGMPQQAVTPPTIPGRSLTARLQRGAVSADLPAGVAEGLHSFLSDESSNPTSPGVTAAARKAIETPQKFLEGFVRSVAVRALTDRVTQDTFFAAKGEREYATTLYDRAAKSLHDAFDRMTPVDRIDFMERTRSGTPQPTPELQKAADFSQAYTDSLYKAVSKYDEGLPYIDKYGIPAVWKVAPKDTFTQGQPTVSAPGRSTLEGAKGFTKTRFWQSIKAGIDNGGVLASDNPMDLLATVGNSAMKFVTANQFWEGMKDSGGVRWVDEKSTLPEGFVKWNEPTGIVGKTPPKGADGKTQPGYWAVDTNASTMLKNYLSRDYLRDTSGTEPGTPVNFVANAGRGLMAIKNAYTSWELGFSGFHAMFLGSEVHGSLLGLAMRKALNSADFSGAGKDLIKGLAPGYAVKDTFSLGRIARKYFDATASSKLLGDATSLAGVKSDPMWGEVLKSYPDLDGAIQSYFDGGGTFTLTKDFQAGLLGQMKKAFANSDIQGLAAAAAKGGVAELISYPLFHVYIPNLKLGLFLKEYSQALREQGPRIASGQTTELEIARRTQIFVEDRLGEMNFDNLVWNKTFKTVMQLASRSITWKLGSLKAMSKAPLTQGREFAQAVGERRAPLLTPEFAWLAGSAMFTAIGGGLFHAMMTGQPPKSINDMLYPQYDANDPKARAVFPGYWKELDHLIHSPGKYLTSGAAGMWGKAGDVARNRDFYGTEVYNDEDPTSSKILKSLGHILPRPISYSTGKRVANQGGTLPEVLAMGSGVMTKAPQYAIQDHGEATLRELLAEQTGEIPTRTPAQAERKDIRTGIERSLLDGRHDNAIRLAKDGLSRGVITEGDIDTAMGLADKNHSPEARFENAAKGLNLPRVIKLWEAAGERPLVGKGKSQRDIMDKLVVLKLAAAADPDSRSALPPVQLEAIIEKLKKKGFDFQKAFEKAREDGTEEE